MGYIIKDVVINRQDDNDTQVYYMGKDGHVWTSPIGEPYVRRCNAVKAIEREQNYDYNTNFTRIDNETFTYNENKKWFHFVEVIEVQ